LSVKVSSINPFMLLGPILGISNIQSFEIIERGKYILVIHCDFLVDSNGLFVFWNVKLLDTHNKYPNVFLTKISYHLVYIAKYTITMNMLQVFRDALDPKYLGPRL
jgi:hypothetical protein